jgi:hypothetical protein
MAAYQTPPIMLVQTTKSATVGHATLGQDRNALNWAAAFCGDVDIKLSSTECLSIIDRPKPSAPRRKFGLSIFSQGQGLTYRPVSSLPEGFAQLSLPDLFGFGQR